MDLGVEGTSDPFFPITAVQIKLISPGLWNAFCQCWLWKDAFPLPASLPPPELPSEQAKWGRLVRECLVSTPKVGNRKKEGVLINSFSTHPPAHLLNSGPSPTSLGMTGPVSGTS